MKPALRNRGAVPRVCRQAPPNPHVVLYHTREAVTDQAVESLRRGSSVPERPWLEEILALPGLRGVSLNPYVVRVRKQKGADWGRILGPVERILKQHLGVQEIPVMIESEAARRRFAWHGEPFPGEQIFEGKAAARAHRVAAALFEVRGVAEVILKESQVEVRKCPLCTWRELATEIEHRLATLPDDAPTGNRSELRDRSEITAGRP